MFRKGEGRVRWYLWGTLERERERERERE